MARLIFYTVCKPTTRKLDTLSGSVGCQGPSPVVPSHSHNNKQNFKDGQITWDLVHRLCVLLLVVPGLFVRQIYNIHFDGLKREKICKDVRTVVLGIGLGAERLNNSRRSHPIAFRYPGNCS